MDFQCIVGTRKLPDELRWSMRDREDRSYVRPLLLKAEAFSRMGLGQLAKG
jgi:hypothetical protein